MASGEGQGSYIPVAARLRRPLRAWQAASSCPCRGCPFLAVLLVSLSVLSISATPWTVACQASLSLGFGFPRQEYWSGLAFPSPGDLPNPGIKPTSPALAGGLRTTEPPGKPSTDFTHSLTGLGDLSCGDCIFPSQYC